MSINRMFDIHPYFVLTTVFLILKTTNQVDWAWWAVLSPMFLCVVMIMAWLFLLTRSGGK